jgi:hypothetical protein
MRVLPTGRCLLTATLWFLAHLNAQDLQPRAYLPSPVGLSFFGVSYSNISGGLLFDPTLPVENGHVSASIPQLALGQSLNVFGRTSQVLAVIPYAVADVGAIVNGTQLTRHRSGLADSLVRFSTNIYGAPAMRRREFAKYRPKTIVGASISILTPTGQYDPNVLINLGANRWAFKPEIGVSRFVGLWEFEAAFGVWLYSRNSAFYGGTYRSQDPLGSVQAHIVRMLPHRMWAAFDGTFFSGGRTYTGMGVQANYQGDTRIGATLGIALNRRQAIRFAYFDGVTARIGTDIRSVSVAYQVIWHESRE